MNIREIADAFRPEFKKVLELPELEGKVELLAAFPKMRGERSKARLLEAIDTFRAGVEIKLEVADQIAAIRSALSKHFGWHDETINLRYEHHEIFEEMFTFVDEGDFSFEAVQKLIGIRAPRDFLYTNRAIKEEAFFEAVCELMHATPEVVEGLRLLRETIGFATWRARDHWEIFSFSNSSDRHLAPSDFSKLRPMLNFFGVKTLCLRSLSPTPEEIQAIVEGCKEMPHIEKLVFQNGAYVKLHGEFRFLHISQYMLLEMLERGMDLPEFAKKYSQALQPFVRKK